MAVGSVVLKVGELVARKADSWAHDLAWMMVVSSAGLLDWKQAVLMVALKAQL